MAERRAGRLIERMRPRASGSGRRGRAREGARFFADPPPGPAGLALFLNAGRPAARRLRGPGPPAGRLQGRLPRARRAVPELAQRRARDPGVRRPRARRRRRPGGGARLRRERPPPALPPEDRAPGRLELLDQADCRCASSSSACTEQAPTACWSTGCRRGCAPLLRDRRGGRPADRHHLLRDVGARRDRGGRRARLGLHLPGLRLRQERNRRAARPQRAGAGPGDHARATEVPIAVGFGVKTREHIEALGAVGADAAIVGSACVARVAAARDAGRDVVEDFQGCSSSWARPSPSRQMPR